jgi:hypothetical protein
MVGVAGNSMLPERYPILGFLTFDSEPMLGGYIQIPSATKSVNRIKQFVAAVPWESGKRSLFSIFSMASYQPSPVGSLRCVVALGP